MTDFNFDDFRKEKYEDRTADVELKDFGESGHTQIWKVRGLNSVDLAKIDEAQIKNMELKQIKETDGTKEAIKILSDFLGFNKAVPDMLIRKYIMFELGSVEPKPKSRPDTVKFAAVYPIEFAEIIKKINTLTGLGSVKKKQKNSGQKEPLKAI